MKSSIRNLAITSLALATLVGARTSSNAATVGVDPAAAWIGYMNWSEIPSHGGAPAGARGWGTSDLCANWAGPVLTLSPNTIGDPAASWYTPSGGPGSVGNKIMDANMYVETALGLFTGQTLTFEGNVLSNSLFGKVDANGNGWTSVAFIKDFAPDYSSFVTVTAPLVNGLFSINLATINDPARHVHYGFETVGPDVWVTDVAPYGSIQITQVPEPGTLALLALGLSVPALLRRRRQ